jgi:hypothetical protein
MIDKNLVERIRDAKYGVVTLNDGVIEYKTINPKNKVHDFFSMLYLFAETKLVVLCSQYKQLRDLVLDDAKAIWLYRGSDVKLVGLKSNSKSTISDIRKVIQSIDAIADIKNTDITCATNISRKIMERLGYSHSTDGSVYSYYIKNRKKKN